MTRLRFLADAVAFSSLLAAAIGFALSMVSSLALAAPDRLHWALLTSTGTFVIYNLDRLRDTSRDASTAPDRTAFVERNRGPLTLAVAAASILFGGLLFAAPQRVILLCLGVGLVGLLHRRIKRASAFKALYVSLAWVAACVGFPWLARGGALLAADAAWAGGVLAATLIANLAASNVRDGEAQFQPTRPERVLIFARGSALLGIGLACLAPPAIAPLGWIAAAELATLVRFQKNERYGLLVIDGALLLGSLASAAHFALVTAT